MAIGDISMLRSREELKTLVDFLDWLLEPALTAKIRPSQTEAELRKVQREISHLEELTGFYVNEAVSKLRQEESKRVDPWGLGLSASLTR